MISHNKHYIRIDANNCIIKGFSDAFEQPEVNDICINQEGDRHFELLGQVNPSLTTISGIHLYKYTDGAVTETTESERAAELAAMPKPVSEIDTQTEYLIDLDYRISKIELGV